MEPDLRPRCPHCGEPARQVSGLAQVRAVLQDDGTPGRVLRATHFSKEATYHCGGNHQWTLQEKT